MSRYRPQRAKFARFVAAVLRDVAAATELSYEQVSERLGALMPAASTDNYRALDRPLVRGSRTPLQWPPLAGSRRVPA
jgi:hypothetical protein